MLEVSETSSLSGTSEFTINKLASNRVECLYAMGRFETLFKIVNICGLLCVLIALLYGIQ